MTATTEFAAKKRLLRAPELADRLAVSQGAVWKWLGEGRIPAVRLGRAVRFDLDEVLDRFAVRQ